MKVGVFTVILRNLPLEQALDYLASLGVQTVEIGTGAYTGSDHCDADDLLASDGQSTGIFERGSLSRLEDFVFIRSWESDSSEQKDCC